MIAAAVNKIQSLVDSGRFFAAEQASKSLVQQHPQAIQGWMLLMLCAQRLRHFDLMCVAALNAVELQPDNLTLKFKYVEALLFCGEGITARQQLQNIESNNQHDAECLSRVAELFTEAGMHHDRLRCAQRALQLQPGNHYMLANLAAAETACGEMGHAESHLNELMSRYPDDHGACYRLSTLRKQTPSDNHVSDYERRLARVSPHSGDVVPLCYALAKEYEDLGEFERSFQYLKRGADQRRRQLGYSVDEDVQTIAEIIRQFDRSLFQATHAGVNDESPIFVMGLPRSGTTLVDRILSSHSVIQSLGEINDLAYTIVKKVQVSSDRVLNKLELIQGSIKLDFAMVGSEYLRSVQGYGLKKQLFIDKTPWNFLYLGLIALALPNAKIIHVRRHPMDSCYALYKTLFRGGSPYSYDLDDLARYYIGYHQLMQHWRSCLPGRFLELSYEQLVQSQQQVTGQLLDYCKVGFEPACVEFYRNPEPAATASAAQVREPIHSRSVSGWKKYESQLAPLAEALRNAGVAIY